MLQIMLCPCECVTRAGLVALLSALQLNDNLQIEIEIDASVNPLGALGVYMISASLPTITKLGHPHDDAPPMWSNAYSADDCSCTGALHLDDVARGPELEPPRAHNNSSAAAPAAAAAASAPGVCEMIASSLPTGLRELGVGGNNSPRPERVVASLREYLLRARDLKVLCVAGSASLRLKEVRARWPICPDVPTCERPTHDTHHRTHRRAYL